MLSDQRDAISPCRGKELEQSDASEVDARSGDQSMNSQYPSPSSSSTSRHRRARRTSPRHRVWRKICAPKPVKPSRKSSTSRSRPAAQAKDAAASLASDASQKAKGLLNMQVSAWLRFGRSCGASPVRCAADNLDPERSASWRAWFAARPNGWKSFRETSAGQTVEDLVRTASEFTRRQPALIFGLASLAGFLAFRVLKSSPPRGSQLDDRSHEPFGESSGTIPWHLTTCRTPASRGP